MNLLCSSLLADLPPFAEVEPDRLDELLAGASASAFQKGRSIFRQGDDVHSFFMLLDGHIRVVKSTPGGERIIVRYVCPGELFGIAPAIGQKTFPATAVAAVDCVVLTWPACLWPEIARNFPTFAANAYSRIGLQLQDTQERIVEMATERAEQRVAHALLKLARQNGVNTADGILIDFPISRQDISDMTGTTLHTVSRILSRWEQKGLVKSGRQKVTVKQADELSLLADGEH